MRVLVAYATKYGSTREVAEAVAERLRRNGLEVDTSPAAEVRTVEAYDAVVLGTALYFFHVHSDARHFLDRNRRELEKMPVALFGLGPTEDTAEQFEGAREHLGSVLEKRPWLTPVAMEVFGGRLVAADLRFPDNNPAMKNMADADLRDWKAIEEWAGRLPGPFGLTGIDVGAGDAV
jgi:menaquinone-dependent protoporphyrinogen oxidase